MPTKKLPVIHIEMLPEGENLNVDIDGSPTEIINMLISVSAISPDLASAVITASEYLKQRYPSVKNIVNEAVFFREGKENDSHSNNTGIDAFPDRG